MTQETAHKNPAEIELATAPVGRLMLKYSVPCIVSLLVSALYNIVDQLFIANADYLGSYGNAANNVVFPLVIICLATAGLFGDGTNAYFTFCVGAGRSKDARNSLGTSFTVVAVLSVIFTLIYTTCGPTLLTAFGANVNAETFRNANEYLFWIALGLPFFMLGQLLAPVICGDGSPRYAMVTMLIGCAFNIIFDPILIYKAHWGMKGAAIATIGGQIIVCILNVAYLARMKSIKMQADAFRPRLASLKHVIPLGMTTFFAQISIVLSMAAVNNVLGIYSAADRIFCQEQYAQIPLAVVGLVLKFFQIIVSVSIGLVAGSVPIIGYNRGAGRADRLLELFKKVLIAEGTVGLAAFIVFEGFASPITSLFGAAQESIYYRDFAVACIRIFLSMTILSCLNKGLMIFLQGMGKAAQSTAISIVREIIGGVGLPIVLPMLFSFNGILFFMPLAEIITFALAAVYGLRLRTELKAAIAAEPQTPAAPVAAPVAAPAAAPVAGPRTSTVITIGRSYGAGGRTVGKLIAEQLHIPYYDSELLEKAAENSGLSRKFLEHFNEKPADINQLYRYRGYGASQYGVFESMAEQAQREIIEQVAAEGPCVIVGRRADQVLKGRDTLSVFITASEASRVARICERDGLSELDSIKKIAKVDRERAAYYNQRSEKVWGMPASYDVCIDTDRFGVEGTARLIASMVATEKGAA